MKITEYLLIYLPHAFAPKTKHPKRKIFDLRTKKKSSGFNRRIKHIVGKYIFFIFVRRTSCWFAQLKRKVPREAAPWWASEESNLTGSPFIFNVTYASLAFKHPATTPRTTGRNHPQNADYTIDKHHKIPSFHIDRNLKSIFEFFGYRKG